MQNLTLMKYYQKITDLAFKNLAKEKSFQFKAKLKSNMITSQCEDHLQNIYCQASGGSRISNECQKMIDDYKTAMKKMSNIAVKDYNRTLGQLKNAKDIDEKQKILNSIAGRGFGGFKARNGAMWNIETYSNMYFTHLNNEMVRYGSLERIKGKRIKISNHGTKCHLCKPFEGKIMLKSDLAKARAEGLFHPNCLHLILPV